MLKCVSIKNEIKKRSETQTLRDGYSKAELKKFADPLPGGAGTPKFNQLEMVTTFTYKPSLMRIDARNCRVIVVKQPHTHMHTHRQDRLQYTAPQLD